MFSVLALVHSWPVSLHTFLHSCTEQNHLLLCNNNIITTTVVWLWHSVATLLGRRDHPSPPLQRLLVLVCANVDKAVVAIVLVHFQHLKTWIGYQVLWRSVFPWLYTVATLLIRSQTLDLLKFPQTFKYLGRYESFSYPVSKLILCCTTLLCCLCCSIVIFFDMMWYVMICVMWCDVMRTDFKKLTALQKSIA